MIAVDLDRIAGIVKEAAEHIEDVLPRPGPYHPAFVSLLKLADEIKFVPRGPSPTPRKAVYYDIFEAYVPPTCLCGCYSGGCGRPDGCRCIKGSCSCQGHWP